MNLHNIKKIPQHGFTLIELLVVITIIAILASVAVPTTNIVLRKGRELQAKAAIKGLEVAVKGFQTEYNRFPNIGSASDDTPIDTAADALLVDALIAKETDGTKLNPREIRFYEPPNQKGNTGYNPTSRLLTDPFGKGLGYQIQMDYDGDGQIPNPYDAANDLTTSVIVYCAGVNGIWNKGSNVKSKEFDDLKSWE